MFRKTIEQKRKINELKKDCFDARNNLVVVVDEERSSDTIGCIKLELAAKECIIDAWRADILPENTYRVVGPIVKYCFSFNSKKPLASQCHCSSCPKYAQYQKYVQTLEALNNAKTK